MYYDFLSSGSEEELKMPEYDEETKAKIEGVYSLLLSLLILL